MIKFRIKEKIIALSNACKLIEILEPFLAYLIDWIWGFSHQIGQNRRWFFVKRHSFLPLPSITSWIIFSFTRILYSIHVNARDQLWSCLKHFHQVRIYGKTFWICVFSIVLFWLTLFISIFAGMYLENIPQSSILLPIVNFPKMNLWDFNQYFQHDLT